jgi:hypothetical protein
MDDLDLFPFVLLHGDSTMSGLEVRETVEYQHAAGATADDMILVLRFKTLSGAGELFGQLKGAEVRGVFSARLLVAPTFDAAQQQFVEGKKRQEQGPNQEKGRKRQRLQADESVLRLSAGGQYWVRARLEVDGKVLSWVTETRATSAEAEKCLSVERTVLQALLRGEAAAESQSHVATKMRHVLEAALGPQMEKIEDPGKGMSWLREFKMYFAADGAGGYALKPEFALAYDGVFKLVRRMSETTKDQHKAHDALLALFKSQDMPRDLRGLLYDILGEAAEPPDAYVDETSKLSDLEED